MEIEVQGKRKVVNVNRLKPAEETKETEIRRPGCQEVKRGSYTTRLTAPKRFGSYQDKEVVDTRFKTVKDAHERRN